MRKEEMESGQGSIDKEMRLVRLQAVLSVVTLVLVVGVAALSIVLAVMVGRDCSYHFGAALRERKTETEAAENVVVAAKMSADKAIQTLPMASDAINLANSSGNAAAWCDFRNTEDISVRTVVSRSSEEILLQIPLVLDTSTNRQMSAQEMEVGHEYIMQAYVQNLGVDACEVVLEIELPKLITGEWFEDDCRMKARLQNTATETAVAEDEYNFCLRDADEEPVVLEYLADSSMVTEIKAEGGGYRRDVWEQVVDGAEEIAFESYPTRIAAGATNLFCWRVRAYSEAEYEQRLAERTADPLRAKLMGLYNSTEKLAALDEITAKTVASEDLWRMVQQGKIESLSYDLRLDYGPVLVSTIKVPEWIPEDGEWDQWSIALSPDGSLATGEWELSAALWNDDIVYSEVTDTMTVADSPFGETPIIEARAAFLWDGQTGEIVELIPRDVALCSAKGRNAFRLFREDWKPEPGREYFFVVFLGY